jgi:uracil-DNA glycosylase family 4
MEELKLLNQCIISCRTCPRLVEYRESVARNKIRRFSDWNYWGKPLPGFGDPKSKLLIIGLAPAAHGGNRTGRMFTGDSSGDWLVKALYETGFANQPTSVSKDDGLQLKSAYITASVRCAPPQNKPTKVEIDNCSGYLKEELKILKDVKVVLTLGKIALDTYLKCVKISEKPRFAHSSTHELREDLPTLVISFHPSKQNTQTNRLTWDMWLEIFRKARKLINKRN